MGAIFFGIFLLVIGGCTLIDLHDSFKYMTIIAVIMLGMTFFYVGGVYETKSNKKETTINKIELYKDSIEQVIKQDSLNMELYILKDSLNKLKK